MRSGLAQTEAAPPTPMMVSMDKISENFRDLLRAMRAPDTAAQTDYVQLAVEIREQAVKSRAMVPLKIQQMPQTEHAATLEKFQKAMDAFIATTDKLILALKASDWEASKAVLDTMKVERDEGHEKFQIEEAPAPASPAAN